MSSDVDVIGSFRTHSSVQAERVLLRVASSRVELRCSRAVALVANRAMLVASGAALAAGGDRVQRELGWDDAPAHKTLSVACSTRGDLFTFDVMLPECPFY